MSKFEVTFKNFQNYILNQDATIHSEVNDAYQIEVKSRLQIYRTAYYLRLLEVLAYDFGRLKTYIGEERFNQLGRAYIAAHPSYSPSILEFGHCFPEFLSTQKKVEKEQLELAQFELALEKVRPISVTSKITVGQLNDIAPEAWADIEFILNPTVQVFESLWKGPQFWRAIANKLPYPAIEPVETPEKWLVWSGQGVANFYALTAQTSCFFEAFKAGKTFGEVCEALCDVMPEDSVGEFAGRYLNQWIFDGVIIEFRLS